MKLYKELSNLSSFKNYVWFWVLFIILHVAWANCQIFRFFFQKKKPPMNQCTDLIHIEF